MIFKAFQVIFQSYNTQSKTYCMVTFFSTSTCQSEIQTWQDSITNLSSLIYLEILLIVYSQLDNVKCHNPKEKILKLKVSQSFLASKFSQLYLYETANSHSLLFTKKSISRFKKRKLSPSGSLCCDNQNYLLFQVLQSSQSTI